MIWLFLGFSLFIVLLLALDLGVLHRKAHEVSMKEALGMSAFWIGVGLVFSVFIYFAYDRHLLGLGTSPDPADGTTLTGTTAVVKYLTGYVVEKSLSVDNVFVIAILFSFFAIPAQYQHRVLFWGILGALVMRAVMILVGASLIARFHWLLYVFGGFLVLTGIKMFLAKAGHGSPGDNVLVKLTRKLFPVTDTLHGQSFLVRLPPNNALHLTPLALVLIMVEATDLIFAVDSIPAIFAITADPFLVFTSNVFAILGLRSLYFALSGLMHRFHYLKPALALILLVVGIKMLTATQLKALLGQHFNFYLLGVVLLILGASIALSLAVPKKTGAAAS